LAACVGAVGSIYVLRSYLAMTPALTADLATPRFGFSTVVIDALSDQRAESVVGAVAFGGALLLGIASIFAPDYALLPTCIAVIGTLVGTSSAVVLMDWCRTRIASSHRHRSRETVLRNQLISTLSDGRFSKAYVEELVNAARILLGLHLDVATGPKAVCEAIAAALGCPLPPDVDIPSDIPTQ
jgi:hypothetical protein